MKTCKQIEEQYQRLYQEIEHRYVNRFISTEMRNKRCSKIARIAAGYQLRIEHEKGLKYNSFKHQNTPFSRLDYAGW
jgi:hypothetical protein